MLMVLATLAVQGISQIPNGGFEEWVVEQNNELPVLWTTNQDNNLPRFEKDTHRVQGSYSLKILSESSNGWDGCTNKASIGVKLGSPLGKDKTLSLFVRSMPHSTNTTSDIFLRINGKLFSEGVLVYEYAWKAEGPIPEFTEVAIPLYRSATDSLTIEISGGALSGATDVCSARTISWIDAISIIEIPDVYESDCAERITYSPGMAGVFFTNMFRQNDTLVVSGILKKVDNGFVQHPLLVRFDTMGQLLDYFVFQDSLWSDYHHVFSQRKKGLCPAIDGGYLMMNRKGQKDVVWKVSSSGETVWMKEFSDGIAGSQQFRQIESIDDGYLVAGNTRALNYEYDIFVMKLDVFGNKIWEQKYSTGGQHSDYFDDMLIVDDNEVIICGYISPGDEPDDSRLFRNSVFAIDGNGNIKWQWESETSMDQLSAGILRDDFGNWVYTTNFYINESNGTFKVKPKFFKRNAEFELLEERDLDDVDGVFNVVEDIIPVSVSGYLCLGGNYETGVPDNHTYAWMIRLNENGEVLWERKDLAFPQADYTTFQNLISAVELPGGNIIAAGYTYNPTTDEGHGLLIKIDPCGCLDTICEITTSSEQLIGENPKQIIVFPNPTTDYLDVRLPAGSDAYCIELFDMSGRMTLRYMLQVNGTQRIALDNLNHSGVCAWRVLDRHGHMVDQGKVVVLPE